MPVCWEGAELDYSPAPGNSRVVKHNGLNVPQLKFFRAFWEEIQESPVGPRLGDKKRPVKSGDSLRIFRAEGGARAPKLGSHVPPWPVRLNKTLPCVRKTLAGLSSRHKATQSFFSLPFPVLCTHWHFCVLDFFCPHHHDSKFQPYNVVGLWHWGFNVKAFYCMHHIPKTHSK